MMSSCCTLRLKRRKAFSKDSDSWMMTSATLNSPPIRFGLVTCGVVFYGAPPMDIIACNQRHVHEHVDRMYGASCSQFGYQVSSDSCEKSLAERQKRRSVGLRYTYGLLVKISKAIDLGWNSKHLQGLSHFRPAGNFGCCAAGSNRRKPVRR